VSYRRKKLTFAISSPDEFLLFLDAVPALAIESVRPLHCAHFTARRHASAVYASSCVCPSVSLSVCHKSAFYLNW